MKRSGKKPAPPAGRAAPAGDPKVQSARISRRRKWLFRLVAMLLAPVLFLVLLEIGLWAGGYGYSTSFFEKVPGQDAYTANLRFGWRFFPRSQTRSPILFRLPANKGAETYRIFVLGSSAAMGTPDPAFSFSRFLEVMLRQRYPGVRFEVINTGMVAINSHVVRPIARECADHQPDLFIVYMGNNEVVGPYGPGTVFKGSSLSRGLIRASLWAKSTRIGQLLDSLVRRGETINPEWRGMEMFTDQRVPADDPRLERTYDHLRSNLTDICRAGAKSGAKVIVCTVPVNLKDCAPFASMHRGDLAQDQQAQWEQVYQAGVALEDAGRFDPAIERFQAAARTDDRFAELHFRLGRCHLAQGRKEQARQEFVLARDLDALRFRADTRINDTIRQVAADMESHGVFLLDAERALDQSPGSPQGIPGEELFYEHVHLTVQGNYELAAAILARVGDVLPDSIRARAASATALTLDQCAQRLALTPVDRLQMENEMLQLTSQPPFTGQCDHAQRRRQLLKRLHELNRAVTPAAATESLAACRKALSADPDDLLLRQKLARLLLAAGDAAGASQQYDELLSRLPDNGVLLLVSVPPLLGQKKIAEADARFEQGLRRAANPLNVYLGLAPAYAQAGLPDKAVWCYQEALKIAPNSATVHGGLGKVLAEQKRFPEAVAEYLKAVELDPSNAEMHCSLGVALLEKAEPAAALPHLLKAAELDPFSARAHEYLAAALIAQGRKPEALDHLGQAIRLDEFNGQLHRRYARALHREGQFAKAAEEYRQVVQLAFQPMRARVDLAWLLATCPDPAVRNVPQAVELAEEANRIAGGRSGPVLDALGAALAAAGRFDQAVPLTTTAMESANRGGQTAIVAQMQQRLELYRRNQPFLTSEPYPSGD